MFSKIPAFFSMPNAAAATAPSTPTFAGMPLVNPLLNDAQQNIESLDERIQQLESVAQWLNMNLQLVNSTVQQLQVQKQTLQALAQWQALSKDALGELAKMNPFAAVPDTKGDAATQVVSEEASASVEKIKSSAQKATVQPAEQKMDSEVGSNERSVDAGETEDLPVAFEKMAKSWWDGLQNQFAQLAQPLMDAAKSSVDDMVDQVDQAQSKVVKPRASRAKKTAEASVKKDVAKTVRKPSSATSSRTKR